MKLHATLSLAACQLCYAVRAGDAANPENITVGFDLKVSYGTAAISYPNGTSREIACIQGNEQYKKTLQKLSSWDATHYA